MNSSSVPSRETSQTFQISLSNWHLPLEITERKILLVTVDLILVNMAVLLALRIWALRAGEAFTVEYILSQTYWFPFLSLLWLFAASLNELHAQRVVLTFETAVPALLKATGLLLFMYLGIYFASPRDALPRLFVIYFGILSFLLICVWRIGYSLLLSRPAFRQPAVIVGAGWAGRVVASAIRRHLNSAYQLIGFIDDDPAKQNQIFEELRVIGTSDDLPALAANGIAEIILAVPHNLQGKLFQALMDCQELGVRITSMPLLYEEITNRVPVEHIGDDWQLVLPLDHAGTGSFYPSLKRSFDIGVALAGLFIFSLLFPWIYIAMKLNSPGPIFYTQTRVGKGGKPFHVVKLRTMIPNAEENGAVWAKENDSRVTRIGRFLRKTRLDELPQFSNVLRGEMSVVGPRPERPEFVEQLTKQIPFYRARHAVKPGMAGWAVIHQDYAGSPEEILTRLQYDLYYIKHQSLWLDIQILFRTLGKVLTFSGR